MDSNDDEKKDEASSSPYSLAISILNNKLTMQLYNKNTKYMYNNEFTPKQLQKCGFSNKQVSNLEGVSKFIAKAKQGHQGLKFSISFQKIVAEQVGNEGKDAQMSSEMGIIKIVKDDDFFGTMNFTMHLKRIPRDKSDVNDDHIKDLKQENVVLKNEINELKKHVLPKGSIVMWSGTVNNIPNCWKLCDGNNGTPDLRDRFIIGAGRAFNVNKTGGSKSHKHNITVNGHRLTVNQIPSHSHNFHYQLWGHGGNMEYHCCNKGNKWLSMHKTDNRNTKPSGGNQVHNHSATASATSTLPPYFAMCFIIKQI